MEVFNQNNLVRIAGKVTKAAEFNYEMYEEKFYRIYIEVSRLSNQKDILPVIVSERLINVNKIKVGDNLRVKGQFRSYNQIVNDKNKLVLAIFARDIVVIEDERVFYEENQIILTGHICKKPIYRKTPLGREITDVLIAVNRTTARSDYIPTIIWGRNAKYCSRQPIGTVVKIEGRMQAREYNKVLSDGTTKKMTAYEVSVIKFKVLNENDNNKKEENIESNINSDN